MIILKQISISWVICSSVLFWRKLWMLHEASLPSHSKLIAVELLFALLFTDLQIWHRVTLRNINKGWKAQSLEKPDFSVSIFKECSLLLFFFLSSSFFILLSLQTLFQLWKKNYFFPQKALWRRVNF